MNNNYLRKQVFNSLNQKATVDLVEIWQKHNSDEWSDLAFDVVREILQNREEELPPQDKPSSEQAEKVIRAEIDRMTDTREIDRRIKDRTTLLREAEGYKAIVWIMLVVALFVALSNKLYMVPILLLFYLGRHFWRLHSAQKQIEEIKPELEEYQYKRAELQAKEISLDSLEWAKKQQVDPINNLYVVDLITASQRQNDKMPALSKLGKLISGDIKKIQEIIKDEYKETKTCKRCGFNSPNFTDFCLNCLTDIHWAKVNLGEFTGSIYDTVLIGVESRQERGVSDL